MPKTSRTAIRGMLLYVIALVALGLVVGAYYTVNGRPSNPHERPASETIPAPPPVEG